MQAPKTTEPKDWLAFDKWDQLGLRITLWAIPLASIAGFVGIPLLRWARGESLPVPFVSRVRVPELDARGVEHSAADYLIQVEDPSIGQRLLDLLPGLLLAALVVVGAVAIRRIARAIGDGDPFAPGQVGRLRLVAGLLMIGAPVVGVVDLFSRGAILAGTDLGGLPPATTLSFPALPVLVGLCLALIAEAFKVGTRLREDVDGLV